MANNICSGPEITRKTLLISCLYRSYTSSKTFHVGLQTVICIEGIQSIYFSADANLHLLHFEFITTFALVLAESVKICVPRGRPARVLFPPTCFYLINKVTVAAPILGSKKRSYEYYGEMRQFCAGR